MLLLGNFFDLFFFFYFLNISIIHLQNLAFLQKIDKFSLNIDLIK